MIEDLRKDTEDTGDTAGTTADVRPKKKKKKKELKAAPIAAPASKKKKKLKSKAQSAPKPEAAPKKKKKKTASKPQPVHKEDMFRAESRLGVAFAILKDGKPHTKKEIAAAIKKKCGAVPWPHRIFGHLRAKAAETGAFLLKEPERGVFVLTLKK